MTLHVDHFHCIYNDPADGKDHEIEGGMTEVECDKIATMTPAQFAQWKRTKAMDWGMPKDGVIRNFRFAG